MKEEQEVKMLSTEIMSKDILKNNIECLQMFSDYKEASDIMEQVAFALGRRQRDTLTNVSTENWKISQSDIPPSIQSYKI